MSSGLIYYWPFTSGYHDTIQCSVPIFTSSSSIVDDSSSPNKKSLYLKNGYLSLKGDVYFSGDFSITSWVKMNARLSGQKLIDCANGPDSDNVYISISYGSSFKVLGIVYIGKSATYLLSNTIPSPNVWYHLSLTLSTTTLKLYINGILDSTLTNSLIPVGIVRNNCFIGRSNWPSAEPNADAYLRDFRIYNRTLSDNEIGSLLINT